MSFVIRQGTGNREQGIGKRFELTSPSSPAPRRAMARLYITSPAPRRAMARLYITLR
ncbi:MAG: hypothetical protein ACLFWI_12490 [Coleofasciculus sp.]|uniref:hypothetical protein n=1 Tax=Coleofasciculus sp. TaxID=3100458 RepID=UPI003A1E94E8